MLIDFWCYNKLNMLKALKITFLVLLFLGLVLGGYFFYKTQSSGQFLVPSQGQVENGELFSEDKLRAKEYTGTKIEGESVLAGKFIKVEDGKIFFEEEGEQKELPATDNFTFVCTRQAISDEAVFNYDQVNSVQPIEPEVINEKINAGENVLILVNKDGTGNLVANSIVSLKCGVQFNP